jgi:acyl-CoA thioesterase YciA
MSLIDECGAIYAAQICDTSRIVTIKIEELIFKKPVRVGNIIKFYGSVVKFGNTSVTLYIEARKHNVHTGDQEIVTHTNITFVRIDDEGVPLRISERVKQRYNERVNQFGKGLLTKSERKIEKNK